MQTSMGTRIFRRRHVSQEAMALVIQHNYAARTVTCRMFNLGSRCKFSEVSAKHEALLPLMLRNLKHDVCQIGRWLSNARLDKVTPAKALTISQPRHHA